MFHKVLDLFFDWDDVLIEDLYFLPEVFYNKVIGCFFLALLKTMLCILNFNLVCVLFKL